MAFVAVPASGPRGLRASSFCGRSQTETRASSAATVPSRRTTRMLVEDGEVAPTKGSQWKENLFTGGIPGGEEFYKQWIEDGMEGDFPDLPERMQPSQPKLDGQSKARSFLKRIDSMEFFKDFAGSEGVGVERSGPASGPGAAASSAVAAAGGAAAAAAATVAKKVTGASGSGAASKPVGLKIGGKTVTPGSDASGDSADGSIGDSAGAAAAAAVASAQQAAALSAAMAESASAEDPEAPDESLYEQYFPKSVRNLAPEISMVSERDFFKDRVGVAMTPVVAKCTDVYFPREMEGKAPFIDIFYNGSVTTASISVKLDDVEPLPGVAPPVPAGTPTTQLVPGAGGGLKLEFEADGKPVNAYSDPRCSENFDRMFS